MQCREVATVALVVVLSFQIVEYTIEYLFPSPAKECWVEKSKNPPTYKWEICDVELKPVQQLPTGEEV